MRGQESYNVSKFQKTTSLEEHSQQDPNMKKKERTYLDLPKTKISLEGITNYWKTNLYFQACLTSDMRFVNELSTY